MRTTSLLLPCLASLVLPLVINAAIEDDYTFTVTDGEATITNYSGPGGDVVIPSTLDGYPVVAIGEGRSPAFSSNETLTRVVIPDSVTFIKSGSFLGSDNLTSIDVDPDNSDFSSLSGVLFDANQTVLHTYPPGKPDKVYEIPNSVTSIGDSAFSGCTSLTDVVIPNSVTSIGNAAFWGCTSLTSVVIPNSVTSIGNSAFGGCTSLTNVEIPNNVTSIGNSTFWGCTNLTSVVIPNSVTSIGNSVFRGCTSLTNVEIPNSVTSIGDSAFRNCTSLTSVLIPDSVTFIESGSFLGSDNLTSIDVDPDNSDFSSFSGVLFDANQTMLHTYPPGKPDKVYEIPNSVTSIGDSAFSGCTSLTGVVIPDSVTSIRRLAFENCTSLTSVEIPNSVTSIGTAAFIRCTSLTNVVISDSVTSIGLSAFRGCTSLTSVVIPNSVTSIGTWAFEDCTRLERAVFRGSAPSMGFSVFLATASTFSVFFFDGAEGFTSPTWKGYPAMNLGQPRPFRDWLVDAEVLSAAYTNPASDLNGDGVSLLMAYALNLDPRENLRSRMPQAFRTESGLTMTFGGDQAGVTYSAETSTDLINWTTSGVIISEPNAEGFRSATLEMDGAEARFLRLLVAESAE